MVSKRTVSSEYRAVAVLVRQCVSGPDSAITQPTGEGGGNGQLFWGTVLIKSSAHKQAKAGYSWYSSIYQSPSVVPGRGPWSDTPLDPAHAPLTPISPINAF